MREGATGIYFGVDGELGYSTCMLRTKQLNGKYRDPILLELWRSSGADENVEDPWFTGYETLPRWLRLIRSGIGIRSVADGFALQPPEDVRLAAIFRDVWRRRDDVVVVEDNVMLLKIPQDDAGDGLVDTVDRVAVGAAFLGSSSTLACRAELDSQRQSARFRKTCPMCLIFLMSAFTASVRLVIGVRKADGWADERLLPLVAGLAELQPSAAQWSGKVHPIYGVSLVTDTSS